MKKLDMSEFDPKKEYPDETEFILNDRPPEVPIPDFLKESDRENSGKKK